MATAELHLDVRIIAERCTVGEFISLESGRHEAIWDDWLVSAIIGNDSPLPIAVVHASEQEIDEAIDRMDTD